MRMLVTAGPTREAIDPVRFISNRSSGKMGYAVATAAAARGHAVCLISGPVELEAPPGVECIRVESAAQMSEAVRSRVAWCDALVMAAAVADWRPVRASARKLKKHDMAPVLELERTADILESIRQMKQHRLFVGFSAETHNLVAEATRKLDQKSLDLIVGNDVSADDAGFAVDTNRVVLIDAGGNQEAWPLMSKADVADRLVMRIEQLRSTE